MTAVFVTDEPMLFVDEVDEEDETAVLRNGKGESSVLAPPELATAAASPFKNSDEALVSSYRFTSPLGPPPSPLFPLRMVSERPSLSEDNGDGVSRLRVVVVDEEEDEDDEEEDETALVLLTAAVAELARVDGCVATAVLEDMSIFSVRGLLWNEIVVFFLF
jgi:hypothetical protein